MKTTEKPVIVEQIFNLEPQQVWSAITNHKEMIQWYFENIPGFKPEIGFMTQFEVISGERTFTHQWEVTEVIPNKSITYNWNYAEYEGDGAVTFLLTQRGDITTLTLSMVIKEDYSDEIPEFKRESCEAGWNYFIKERLSDYLKLQKTF